MVSVSKGKVEENYIGTFKKVICSPTLTFLDRKIILILDGVTIKVKNQIKESLKINN